MEDNRKRTEYNELLIKEFQGKDPILDIAKIESTFHNGTRESFEVDGNTYYIPWLLNILMMAGT
ncbi:hypothetical protein DSCOOX_17280 [Desulfosarcina ovata subsp. ovata]|uniref:Uncharacterized protein n=1 Tax=Desulfosarcina ovata subsp. ovata TaxID=2752305 RepID=A0A5K8A809_9BACT|nr:hypothetical protein DSCOOX_17280 [Desulfosarcina ovata subsp. ovata]